MSNVTNLFSERIIKNTFLLLFLISIISILYYSLFPNNISHFTIATLISSTFLAYVFTTKNIIFNKVITKLIYTVFILFSLFILINVINVYSLASNAIIINFCTINTSLCEMITTVFFKAKIYRFITLPPEFFYYLFWELLGLLYIGKERKKIIPYILFAKKSIIFTIAVFLLTVTFTTQLMNTAKRMYELSLTSWNNSHLEFLDRFVPYEFGVEHHGWIWEYGKFVTNNTSESATIFIPPQSDIWPQEGNKHYFRWFVYPRNLVQSVNPTAKIPTNSTHVLISRGGWNGSESGWPKNIIKPNCVETIKIIDRYTLQKRYLSLNQLNTKLKNSEWGLITLKKGDLTECL